MTEHLQTAPASFLAGLRSPREATIHPIGLALFRIAFALVMLAEIVQMFRFRHLIFDSTPYVDPIRISAGGILFVWSVAVVCLAAGYKTRLAALVSYGFAVIVWGFSAGRGGYSYHADSFYLVGSLLLMFLPAGQAISIDALIDRKDPPHVSSTYVLALKVVLATVYFDSFIWKIASPMWRAGLGIWVPAAHLFSTYRDISSILTSEVLVRGLGYAVLIFEGTFPLLIWFRRLEIPMIVMGILFHLGILLLLPIPLFSLAVIAFYVGITPPRVFLALTKRWKRFSDPVSGPVPATMAIRALIAGWILCSLLMLLQSPLSGVIPSDRSTRVARLYHRLNDVLYYFAGVQPHGVFDDAFFADYDRQTMLVLVRGGETSVLPYTTPTGRAGGYLSGRVYCMWTWFSLDARRGRSFLERELVRYVTFWAVREGVDLERNFVSVLQRQLDVSLTEWRTGWEDRNRTRPWAEVARIRGPLTGLQIEWRSPVRVEQTAK